MTLAVYTKYMHFSGSTIWKSTSFTRRGFTIIELLVVIMIIGLLTSVATASYLAAQKHARDSARKSSINSIATALEGYYTVQHHFPGDTAITASNLQSPTSSNLACEKFTNYDAGMGGSPYYFYAPPADVTPAMPQCNDSTLGATGTTGNDTSKYFEKGSTNTWLPGLTTYLNPVPIETKFSNANGQSSIDTTKNFADVCDFLVLNPTKDTPTTDACDQVNNQTRTLIYRNLGANYAVYARLESNQDTDFSTQFTTVNGTNLCLPTSVAGVPDIHSEISCVPDPTNSAVSNPVIVYMVRK